VESANGKIYVIGGTGVSCAVAAAVYCYDPATNGWSLKTPMPVANVCFATAVVDGIIYVIGGDYAPTNVYAYNPAVDAWTAKTSMPVPRNRCGAAALNGIIYIVAGCSEGGGVNPVATVEAYNPATDTWSMVAPLPFPLVCPTVAAVNGTLYVTSGCGLGNVLAFTPGTSITAINMYAGLTVAGQNGSTCEIDYCNDLGTTNWAPLTTFVLSNCPCLYIDTNSTWSSHRFYRTVQLQ
jgi:N-acetylneuraminic acid mutarotase